MSWKLWVGAAVGRWTVTGEHFKGGNARVYPVKDPEGHFGALKTLWKTSEESVARFRQEIETLKKMPTHPNVMPLLDAFVDDTTQNRSWYVMEMMTGGSLQEDRQRFVGHLLPALELVREVGRGVHHLHKNNVIHRDLKPDNILLRTPQVPVVSDLGLCWLTDLRTEAERLTPDERATGAWGFRAPEYEHRRCEEIDASADVFSLAKILWWLIDGGAPFPSTHYQFPQFELAQKFGDVRMIVVNTLLSKVMQPDPAQRIIRTSEAFLAELDGLLDQLARSGEGRVMAAISASIQRERSRAMSSKAIFEDLRRTQEATPKLIPVWKQALVPLLEAANEQLQREGERALFGLIDFLPNRGQPKGAIGFAFGNVQFYIQFSSASSATFGFTYYDTFQPHFTFHRQERRDQLPKLMRKLVPTLAGDQVYLAWEGDPQKVPVEPKAFWEEAIVEVAKFPR